jgi:uncharacterized protein (DUF58 family)
MKLEDTMDIVLSLRRKILARPIAISWASGEQFTTSSLRKSKRKGPGLQFFGQKIYDAADGDDPRRIDYNATAAEAEDEMGDSAMIVQTFKSPRVVRMHVLLDVNKSMNLGTKGTFKSLLGALMAGCGIESARKLNDLASFITYSFHPVSVFKSQNAAKLLMPALMHAVEDRDLDEAVIADKGNSSGTGGAGPDAGATVGGATTVDPAHDGGGLALAMKAVSHKTSNVVTIVSDFVNMNEDDWEALRLCGIRHDTIAVFVQDRRERELPKAPWPGMHYRLEDFRGQSVSLWIAPDNSPRWYVERLRRIFGSVTTRQQYAENFKRHETRILERLEECGINTLIVSTDAEDDAAQELLAMLANKMRS